MRGIRIATFVFAALLGCVALIRIVSVQPAPAEGGADSLGQPGPVPAVPPPPPVEGAPVAQPAKRHKAPPAIAPAPRIDAEIDPAPPDIRPTFLDADSRRDITSEVAPAPVTVAAAVPPQTEEQETSGPVIIVPHKRSKQDSRGLRWLKAVGHALGIANREEDPAAQAFR